MGALRSASIVDEHRILMGAVIEKVQSAKSGLNEAYSSLLTGFEASLLAVTSHTAEVSELKRRLERTENELGEVKVWLQEKQEATTKVEALRKALGEAEVRAVQQQAARVKEVHQELQDAVKKCEALEHDASVRGTQLAKARQSVETARNEAQAALQEIQEAKKITTGFLPLAGLGATESGVDCGVLSVVAIASAFVSIAPELAGAVLGLGGACLAGCVFATSQPAVLACAKAGHECRDGDMMFTQVRALSMETVFDGSNLGIEPHSVELTPAGDLLLLDSMNSNLYRVQLPLSRLGKLMGGAKSSVADMFSRKKRPARQHHQHHQQPRGSHWPVQESYAIPHEETPPPLDSRGPTPQKNYGFVTTEPEKAHHVRHGQPYLGGWDARGPQQQQQVYPHHQQQQQHRQQLEQQAYHLQQHQHQQRRQREQQMYQLQQHRQYSSGPQTFYEQSCETTNEVVFGAVQEVDSKRRMVEIKAVNYGDTFYEQYGMRYRNNYIGYNSNNY
ncbi:hypothetical protein TRIUR3_30728 [Triticum urartu]|uniref:Uncharacterized protein n=1 Tax=Triticum urartu TaxID=4572 RepID=M7Z3M6_TRIUA|nr:hypothetical protein TRIUR3_30728 [Triticum urartu]